MNQPSNTYFSLVCLLVVYVVKLIIDVTRAFVVFTDGGSLVSPQQAFLFLETILEETSDDLRSESDYSGPAGWPDSDSDTASVIHVAALGNQHLVIFIKLLLLLLQLYTVSCIE